MKYIFIIFSLVSLGLVQLQAQTVSIPDANFKAYLVGNTSINTNMDSEIQVTEAEAFTGFILAANQSISDATGIEAFINVQHLDLQNNSLTSIDLSTNDKLTDILLTNNSLTSVTGIDGFTNLNQLSLDQNSLTSISIHNCTNLEEILLGNNSLTSVSLTGSNFNAATSPNDFEISSNPITSVDVSGLTNMKRFIAYTSGLTSLDLTSNSNLTSIFLDYSDELTSLNVNGLTSLTRIDMRSTGVTSLDLSSNAALEDLTIRETTSLASLDLSQNTSLKYLQAISCDLNSLDLGNGNNTNITFINVRYNYSLNCVVVDDVSYSTTNWTNKSSNTIYRTECSAPVATSTSPSDEGTYAPLGATGGIVFNEDVQEATGTIALYLADGTHIETIPTGSGDSRLGQPGSFRITWDFNTDLIPSTDYYILVSEGAYEDLAGNKFPGIGAGELDFTANARPLIESTTPSNGATGASISDNLTLDMDVSVYTDGTVNLVIKEYASDNTFETIALSSLDLGDGAGYFPDGIITINPTSDLTDNTQYYVVLEGAGTLKSDFNAESFIGLDDKDDWTFTTEVVDNVAPTVTSFSPADNATDVSVDVGTLTMTLSEDVQSGGSGTIRIRRISSNQVFQEFSIGTSEVTISGNTVTLNNVNTLGFNSGYWIQNWNNLNAIEDLAGNALVGWNTDDVWNFTTEQEDVTAPLATSTSPSDEGTYAPLTATGGIVFNEDVQEGSGTIQLYLADGTLLETIITGTSDIRLGQPAGFRITWDFDTDLIPSTDYYILVSSGAYQDLAGNDFAGIGTGELDFTSNARPLIESLTPANGATNVSISNDLILDMDVNLYTDGDVNLVIKEYSNNNSFESIPLHTLDGGFGAGAFPDGVITINPSSDMAENTQYYVVLEGTGTLKSETNAEAFVGLDDKDDWTFTTETVDNVAPTVTSFSPADDATEVAVDVGSLTMTLSEDVQSGGSGTIRIRRVSSNQVVQEFDIGTSEVTISGNTVTLNNVNTLLFDTRYWIQNWNNLNAIEDLAGNALVGWNTNDIWNFTTELEDVSAPLATSTSPSDEGTYAPLTATGGIVFNEDVQEGSGTIQLYLADGTLLETLTTGTSDNRLGQPAGFRITWDFDTDLIPSTDYYILVSSGAYQDLAGNDFSGIGVGELDFTSNARPLIESLSPSNAASDISISSNLTLDLNVNLYTDGTVNLVIKEFDTDNTFESVSLSSMDVGFGAGSFPDGTITINPTTDLSEETQYYVVLEGTGTLKSESNAESFVGLDDKNDWTFTTEIPFVKSDQTITFDAISDKTYIDSPFTLGASASSGLDVSYSVVSGPISISGNEVTIEGIGTATIAANQPGDDNYNPATTVEVSFEINKADQTITITEIADKFTTDASFDVEASTDSNLELTYEISGPASISGTTVTLDGTTGTATITVSQAGNEYYNEASATESFEVTIEKEDQTITFAELENKTFGDATFNLSATASSGLEVTFEVVSGPISINGTEVSITGAGEASIKAIQSGDDTYKAASDVTRTFTVGKADQTITFAELANKTFGDASFTLSSTSSSGLTVSLSVLSGPVSLDGNEVTITGTGEVSITASQSGDDNYNAADDVTRAFTVAKADQTITFTEIEGKTLGDQSFTLSPSASSELDVSLSVVSGPVTIDGNAVTITGAGTAILAANQAGNDNYNAASEITQTFDIAKADQQITIESIEDKLTTDAAFSVSASINTGLELSYEVTGPASISESTITLDGTEGTVTVTVSQVGNDNYNSTSSSISFSVTAPEKLDQIITFSNIANKTYGDAAFSLSATASSGLDIVYTVLEGPISISGNQVTIEGVGTASIKATQVGNDTYNAAAEITQSFEISKADQTIAFNEMADKVFGDASFDLSATATSGLNVEFEVVEGPISISGTEVTITGVGTAQIKASQPGDEFYNAATEVTQAFTISKADQTITFETIADKTFGDDSFSLVASSNSGLSVEYSIVEGPVSLNGSELTITGAGSATIAVNQSGNDNFNAATEVTQTFIIAKADQLITIQDIESKLTTDEDFEVIASTSSELELSYEIDGPATITGNMVSLEGVSGTVTITVSQAGDDNFNTATESISFEVIDGTILSSRDINVQVKVYPNPVIDYLTIESNESIQAQLYDLNGNVIQIMNANDQKIDMSNVTIGTYILLIQHGDNVVQERIMKVK